MPGGTVWISAFAGMTSPGLSADLQIIPNSNFSILSLFNDLQPEKLKKIAHRAIDPPLRNKITLARILFFRNKNLHQRAKGRSGGARVERPSPSFRRSLREKGA
jgi:hypothetical protein